jgi:membrane associated rhomboid family serine protease
MASMTLSFPPFRGFTRAMVVACTAVFFVLELLRWVGPSGLSDYITSMLWLVPYSVMHGAIWQVVTYSFLHASVTHILFNMLALWFVGSYLEVAIGSRKLAEIYFVSVIGAALCTIAFSYTRWLGMDPRTPTLGASGAIFGLMVVIAMLFGDQEFLLFPLPFRIKAKWLVTIYIIFDLASLLSSGQEHIAYVAHLGGALFAWIYMRLAPRKGYSYATSEAYFGARNGYYRWKRKRAQRKFEVYMRKHGNGK